MHKDQQDDLYNKFKTKIELVSGECYRVNTALEASELVCNVLIEKGIKDVALLNSPISQKGDFVNTFEKKGIIVYTDNFRQVTPDAQAGITQVNYGIAELGSLVQADADVNQRLCSTLVPIHIALISTDKLIPTLKDTMATIHSLPEIPGFVGFITGPSRTSDIERVLTIGVHGPKQLVVVFVDEEVGGVA
ncbi:lactate utilization protein C [Desulfosporosinus sp. HMP52]|uniref:LutC/YkgG family protein n=1 Tax=Desulfosporosinus sp. HMP52 TaxID=1487923 RepID=UPI00051F9635|nr:lactate utilization protein [Desulfosporosinus sp. HMP52]KGK86697.1 lactate utilization protein C [Desulfosporosinus sp. HMP52]